MEHERSCLSDHIRRVLAERIVEGVLRPGERLVELKLAAEFNSSQTPVREALRELESMRLVESSPYRGTRVREINERETSEAYRIRGALERLATETAVDSFRGNAQSLRDLVASMIRAAKKKDREAYARHDVAFHRAIVVGSENRTLLSMWDSLAFETRTRLTVSRGRLDLPSLAAWHELVVDALEGGDGVRAGQLLEEHARSFATVPEPEPKKGKSV